MFGKKIIAGGMDFPFLHGKETLMPPDKSEFDISKSEDSTKLEVGKEIENSFGDGKLDFNIGKKQY